MTKKQFKIYRLVIVVILATVLGLAINQDISFIPPLAIIIAALAVNTMYRQVNEVVADERDYKLAGNAARMTLSIGLIVLTVLGGALVAFGNNDPCIDKIGRILLYVVCFLLVFNIFAYLFYQKNG